MIRNIIFDMGNVLIRYDPEYFAARSGIHNPQDKDLLLKEVSYSPKWPLMDAGRLTEPEMEEYAYARLPAHLHKAARDLIYHWEKPEPIPGMVEFIMDCKKANLGVYLLSNASLLQPDYWPSVPGHELFDGTVVSAFEGCTKPSREIFQRLLERFHLEAGECFFIDDLAENIAGAKQAGIDGFVFHGDVDALRSALRALGLNL